MTLAFAVVLIFILYLIDKHKLWRIAFKIALGLFLFGALLIGGACFWYGYYEPHHTAQLNAQHEAEEKVARLKVCAEWESKHPLGSPVDMWAVYRVLAADNGAFLPEDGADDYGIPNGCEGEVENTYRAQTDTEIAAEKEIAKAKAEQNAPKPKPTPKHYVYVFDKASLTSDACGRGLDEGTVSIGERVEVLETGPCGAKVRTKDGTVGWVYDSQQYLTTKAPTTIAPKEGICPCTEANYHSRDNYETCRKNWAEQCH